MNTVRHQLKSQKINSYPTEIVRIADTQKVIATSGKNNADEIISISKYCQPNDNLKNIYHILQINYQPFRKRKSVVHKLTLKKNETQQLRLMQSI